MFSAYGEFGKILDNNMWFVINGVDIQWWS